MIATTRALRAFRDAAPPAGQAERDEGGATDASDPGPLADSRPFAAVLSDWMARRGLTAYAAAPLLGTRSANTVRNWMAGTPCAAERATRALMTMIDEGRA